MTPLSPGSTIGILGGGQLGRMLTVAAAKLGLNVHILDPDPNCPARKVATGFTCTDYDDETGLTALIAASDVVTYEFENVPAASAAFLLSHGAKLAPNAKALEVAQDRLIEKTFLNQIGMKTAPYHVVDTLDDLKLAVTEIGYPAILKTRRFGYDGKGQFVIKKPDDINIAFEAIGGTPAILEGFIDFDCEISVIAARSRDGKTVTWQPTKNIHRDGILRQSIVPAGVSDKTVSDARTQVSTLLTELDYVGVLGCEFFVAKDGSLIANEFAPRVHNSGHWTVEACAISQFENHIRAVAGWPLGDTVRHSDCVMDNLIGEDAAKWQEILSDPSACLTLYGKKAMRDGRKMGHVTRLRLKP